MINENSKVNLINIAAIEPTRRRSLDAFCEYSNKKALEEISKPKDN